MCKVKDKLMELLENDLTIFGAVQNGNRLYSYHLWTDVDNLEVGAEVTIVNSNCEFEFDGVTGTFEPYLYHCFVVDLEIIDVDLSDYESSKSNNGGKYAFADCSVLKVHEKGY